MLIDGLVTLSEPLFLTLNRPRVVALHVRAYFSVQLIIICAVVKSKRAAEKGNVSPKKCSNSIQTDDLSFMCRLPGFEQL